MTERDIVFFGYNHDDRRWLASLRAALEPYVSDQKLKVWSSDHDIAVGNRWHDVIQNQLPWTRVAILLHGDNSGKRGDPEIPQMECF